MSVGFGSTFNLYCSIGMFGICLEPAMYVDPLEIPALIGPLEIAEALAIAEALLRIDPLAIDEA